MTAQTRRDKRGRRGGRRLLAHAAGKASGLLLLAATVADIVTPDAEFLRTWFGFLPVCFVLFANCFFSSYAPRWRSVEPWSLLALSFVAIGTLSVAASMLDLYPEQPLLPRRPDYVLRQGYFIFLLLPFIIGGYHIWSVCLPSVITFTKRFGIAILALLPVADLATADFFGRWQDGYKLFLDTAPTALLYFIVFSFYTVFSGKRLLPLLLMAVYVLACRLTTHGAVFNSFSALLMALILVILSLPRTVGNARAWLVTALVPLGLIVMAVETAAPSLCRDQERDASAIFSHPGNTSWRCESWHGDMTELVNSHLVGLGYGVPYFPFTFENWLTAKNFASEMNIPRSAAVTDVLYIRGQHSSLVNVFYRLGIGGGVLFLLMNWVLMVRLARASRSDDLLGRLSLISCGLMVVAFIQISANVGLESPRYLINYTLAVSLALVCSEAVDAARARTLRPPARTWHRRRERWISA